MKIYLKTISKISLVLLILLLAQSAWALLVGSSSHYDGVTAYDVTWNDKQMTGWIEFAVYDNASEFEAILSVDDEIGALAESNFIYAYRIYNADTSEDAITYFSVLGLTEETAHDIGSYDDGFGVEPATASIESEGGVWTWQADGPGLVQAADGTWILVYGSDYDWTAGQYEIRGTDEFPSPGEGDPSVPEPMTVALLGTGGAFLLRRKKLA